MRCTTNGVVPLDLRTAVTISSKFFTGVDPTLTTTSPGLIPAIAAGPGPVQSPSLPLLTSGATQEVSPTTAWVGGCRLGSPHTTAITYTSTRPMMKFMAGPANSTATRFQVFCLYIA